MIYKYSCIYLMILFGLSAFWAGCVQVPRIIMFNNSGGRIVIVSDDKSYTVNGGSFAELEWPSSYEFWIEDAEDSHEYRLTEPPPEYMPIVTGKRELFCQLEANGWVYILKPSQTAPVSVLPPQPVGFPLRPILNRTVQ